MVQGIFCECACFCASCYVVCCVLQYGVFYCYVSLQTDDNLAKIRRKAAELADAAAAKLAKKKGKAAAGEVTDEPLWPSVIDVEAVTDEPDWDKQSTSQVCCL